MASPMPYPGAGSSISQPGKQPDAEYTNDDNPQHISDAQRKARMQRAYKAYKGKLPKPLKADSSGLNHSLRENRIKPIVNMGVAFLFGKKVTFSVEKAGGQAAQDWLDAMMAANSQETTLQAYAQNGGIFGHPSLKVIPNGVISKGTVYPRLMVLDPMQVSMECAENDSQCICAYNIEFRGKGPDGVTTVDRRQRIERELPDGLDDDDDVPIGSPDLKWVIREQYRATANTSLPQPMGANQAWLDMPGDNEGKDVSYWCGADNAPLSWSPIHDNQNLIDANGYYGAADVDDDLIELNIGINRVVSDMNKVIHYWGTPQPWAAGIEAQLIDKSDDNILCFPDPQTKLELLEMTSDLPAAREHTVHLMESMDELSGFPGVALGRLSQLPAGDIPGITMKLMFMSALSKNKVKQGTYGNMLELLCSHLLELGGFAAGLNVEVTFGNPLPVSLTEIAAVAQELTAVGVPNQQVMRWLDLDPEEMKRQKQTEADEAAKNAPTPTPADYAKLAMSAAQGQFDAGQLPAGVNPYPPRQPGNLAALNDPKAAAQRQKLIGDN